MNRLFKFSAEPTIFCCNETTLTSFIRTHQIRTDYNLRAVLHLITTGNQMKFITTSLTLSCCLFSSFNTNAAEVYGGVGFPGITVGYAQSLTSNVSLRGEYSGGLNLSRSGTREGVAFDGNVKAGSIGLLADYYPIDGGGFRGTAGLTFNDIKGTLNSTGNNCTATINNKPINLNGLFYNVQLKFPSVTPYLGVGYQSKRNGAPGWGFLVDAGVMVGKFNTVVTQNVVGAGPNPITQADVDAQTNKVRESVNKLSVLPKFTIGVVYSF